MVDRPHNHAEAYCLMQYACQCGHAETMWNSRDGVTPFILVCPKCDGELRHVSWRRDKYAPDHLPTKGQGVFIDLPKSLRRVLARFRVVSFDGTEFELQGDEREEMIEYLANDWGDDEPFWFRWR